MLPRFLLASALLGLRMAGAAPAEPTLVFDPAAGTVRLDGLASAPAEGTEAAALAVRVVPEVSPADLPAVTGTYRFAGGSLTFRPRFAFEPGVAYRATSDGAGSLEFAIPRPDAEPSTVVEAVYPESDLLPENHLRFYLHFSAPMGRGHAAENVRLLDEAGTTLVQPFLDLAEELWDPAGTRLTLLLDPGRVKRGLGPREEFGPILARGSSHTLEIGTGFLDARGQPLHEPFRRTFRVGDPDYRQPEVARWALFPPASGAADPLVVRFDQPLDHAMIVRMLEVRDAEGRAVAGSMTTLDADTACAFTPDAPWSAGSYRLRANRLLEDSAGNSIARPFERKDETFAPRPPMAHVEIGFAIPPARP